MRRISDTLAAHGIRRLGFLLLGGPGETKESVRASMDFAESLGLEMLKVSVGVRIYPRTALARTAVEEGVISADEDLLFPHFYLRPELELDHGRGAVSEAVGCIQICQPEEQGMPRDPIPTWFFALVVVRQGDRFLLVHEAKHGQGWYIPAGRVEPGEGLTQAAVRETLEETGVPVVLDGILRVEDSPRPEGRARLRVIFVGHPEADVPPKSIADQESLEAAWFSLDELGELPLRTRKSAKSSVTSTTAARHTPSA